MSHVPRDFLWSLLALAHGSVHPPPPVLRCSATPHFVIPIEANPDFLPLSAGHGRVCCFP